MRQATGVGGGMYLVIATLVICWATMFPICAATQSTQGQNAVYNLNGNCNNTGSACAASRAFLDASMFVTSPPIGNRNLCGVLNFILNPSNGFIPTIGAVVDARGLNSNNTSMTCTASPWAGITNPPPSNILLPAGTILIPAGWTLPSSTHLIGLGENVSSSTTATVLQATSALSGDMIDFCSSAPCVAVGVENLVLNGNGRSVNGIVNQYAGSLSYVDHVSLYKILGIGLLISGVATGSGPYTNINFDTGSATPSEFTVCAQIKGPTGTAGIRGLNCRTQGQPDPDAAVLLDSSNNSIKDVTIMGFYDGILVGSHAQAQNNVLINVIADTTVQSCVPHCNPINAVHLSSNNNVSDISIMGLSNNGGLGTSTLLDDVTSTTLSALTGDEFVALYALGKKVPNTSSYARFTTTPSVPTWASGTGSPTGSCTQGSLYSCSGSSSSCQSYALWRCPIPGGTWSAVPIL